MFNRTTHHSPYDYLMRRRLAESARDLAETDLRIIDVALDYQFGSPETFSRAFKRMFGLQPRQWRNQGRLALRSAMSRLTLAHLEHRNGADHVRPVLEKRLGFQVAGIVTLVGGDRSTILGLWDLLPCELERAGLNKFGDYYGIASYPENWRSSGFFYMAGIEAGESEILGFSLVTKAIPSSEYACFAHRGSCGDVKLVLDYGYQTWLPRSDRSLAYPLEIECYGETLPGSDLETSDLEILIPVG